MRRNLASVLDQALARLRAGEPIPAILADYPADADQLAPLLEAAAQLRVLEAVEMPPTALRTTDRRRFLQEAAHIRSAPVSSAPLKRLIEWNLLKRRARPMLVPVVKILLVLGLIFGAAGGTAAAADASVPGDLLYPLDLAMEDLQLALTSDPAAEADLLLQQANERVEEMVRLVKRGEEVDEALLTRLHLHLSACLDRMAELDEPEMLRLMERLRLTIQAQTRLMSRLEEQTGDEASRQMLERTVRLMAEVQAMVEAGLEDPATFRLHYQLRIGPPEEVPVFPMPRTTELPGPRPTPSVCPEATPGKEPHHTPCQTPCPTKTPAPPPEHGPRGGGPGASEEQTPSPSPGEGGADHLSHAPISFPEPSHPLSSDEGSGSHR